MTMKPRGMDRVFWRIKAMLATEFVLELVAPTILCEMK
jgi:hypothetical protein